MLAQSLVEYSLVASVTQSLQRGRFAVEAWIQSLSATEWAAIAGVLVIVLVFRSVRRSS